MELPQSNTQIPVYSYTRTELLSLRTKTSLISLSTVDRLKDLNIGYHLPRRHRSSRGVKRKKQNLHSFIVVNCCEEFSSVENANQFCYFLRTVLDKHAPPSLRKVITQSFSPWFESIRDEHFIAKRERRQAERKWRNTKLTIFKDLYEKAK